MENEVEDAGILVSGNNRTELRDNKVKGGSIVCTNNQGLDSFFNNAIGGQEN